MQHRGLGLSAADHHRASALLQRTYAALLGVSQMLSDRYSSSHPVQKECEEAIASVQSLRIELENTARAEHPDAKIIYLKNEVVNNDSLINAVAEGGEDADELD
jgi:uncharacterized protein involved in exopolysaccharide biosynthesis